MLLGASEPLIRAGLLGYNSALTGAAMGGFFILAEALLATALGLVIPGLHVNYSETKCPLGTVCSSSMTFPTDLVDQELKWWNSFV